VVSCSYILPIRHRSTGIRVDLAVGMSGFERDAVGRATPVAIGDLRVSVVSVEDLMVMKALAGRPQDDLDIRGLVAAQGDVIDWPRCLTGRGKSPPDVFPRLKTSGFHGSCAAGIASLRSSRLFIHSLLTGRGKSPPGLFPGTKTSGFHGSCAAGIASLRSSRLFIHSLLPLAEALGAAVDLDIASRLRTARDE